MRTPLLVGLAATLAISCTKTQVDAPSSSAAPVVTASSAPVASASAADERQKHMPGSDPSAAVVGVLERITDTIKTPECDLQVTPLHHATLLLRCKALSIYVDPVHDTSYAGLPKADLIDRKSVV